MKDLTVHVLFRFSKKTGKIDITMTGLGEACMELWALNNTPKTKACLVVERDTGKVVYMTVGTGDFPCVKKEGELGNIEEYGISFEVLQEIKDERFDK